jgi:predicted patatin/cPLA2 family phospholipase
VKIRGNLSVLTALARGEEVLVIVLGGGLSCVISLGVLTAFADAGLYRFKAGIAVSGGACNLAALMSDPGKMRSVLDVFEYLACGGFLQLKIGPLGPHLCFDREELIQTLEGKRAHYGLPSLNEKAIAAHPTPFWIVATDHHQVKGVFLDGKTDLFSKLRATMSIPGACSPVEIAGQEVSDGQVSLKAIEAIRKVRTRKVIVILNRPPFDERTWWEQLFTPVITRMALWKESLRLRETAATMDGDFARELRRLERSKRIETLVIHPTLVDDLWPWTNNVLQLRRSFNEAMHFTTRLIERAVAT